MAYFRASLLLSYAAVILLTAGCGGLRHAQQQRESTYQQTLRSYSEALKPGTNRKDVKEYLTQRHQKLTNNPDIFIDIGSEPHRWFCSHRRVFLAFHFDTNKDAKPSPSDLLESISMVKSFSECLLGG